MEIPVAAKKICARETKERSFSLVFSGMTLTLKDKVIAVCAVVGSGAAMYLVFDAGRKWGQLREIKKKAEEERKQTLIMVASTAGVVIITGSMYFAYSYFKNKANAYFKKV